MNNHSVMDIITLITRLKNNNIDLSLHENDLEISYDGDDLPDGLLNEIRRHKAGIIGFLRTITPAEENSISLAAWQQSYPMSAAQKRCWGLCQFEEASRAYHIPGVYVFEGDLDAAALEMACNALMARHEVLRTVFKENEQGEVRQWILPVQEAGLPLITEDLRGEKEQDLALRTKVQVAVREPFDLQTAPLLRTWLYRVGDNKWVFLYVIHHIICDGWSLQVLVKELLTLYNAKIKGIPPMLPGLKFQYKDYVVWQQEQKGSSAAHRAYWLQQLNGDLPVLDLPYDKPRPAIKTYNGAAVSRLIGVDTSRAVRALCLDEGCTLFIALLGAVNVLLYRYTGQEDIIIGSPIAGRAHTEVGNQIGLYVNTLTLRTRFNGSDTYKQLLGHIKQVTLDAYEHEAYPFDELVEDLQLQRDLSRNPLFDVAVVLHNTNVSHTNGWQQFDRIKVREYEGGKAAISKFDLGLYFIEMGEDIQLEIEYNTDVFTANSIERLGGHLIQLLAALTTQPELSIQQLDFLSEEEKSELLSVSNDTTVNYPDKTITDLFEAQAACTPHNTAVVFEGKQVSYKELNETANQLAAYLRYHYDVQPDELIGVNLERSEWIVIVTLAVLKAGGAYVPVDPAYPQERIDFIIADSRCKTVIDEQVLDLFRQEESRYSKANLPTLNKPADLAYVIYTSGTTGNPKGALITHNNVVRLFKTDKPLFDFTAGDVWTMFHSYCFDFSVWEMYGALLYGGKLIIVPEVTARDPEAFLTLLASEGVTVLNQTPSAFYNLIKQAPDIPGPGLQLRYVIFGGEALSPGKLAMWKQQYPATRLINMYGITETTVHVTFKEIGAAEIAANISNIGRPIPTLNCYVLDQQKNIVPEGVWGELYVGGEGVCRGYLNRPELTGQRFISGPFRADERLYRSGDKVRWLSNGELEYGGRIDDQVKVRGYRIELGEIADVLQKHPAIESAVVLAKQNKAGEKELVAYIVNKETIPVAEIRTYVRNILPAYMLPAHYVQLENIPLNANGKVNRKLLPDPVTLVTETGAPYIPPANKTEEKLVSIWEELLGRERIGVRDDFFLLGGHSLKATQLASHIFKTFQVKISVRTLFERTVVEQQAQYIQQARKTAFTAVTPVPARASYPASFSQRRLWVLCQFEATSLAYNLHGVYVFEGDFKSDAFENAFNTLIRRHEILRTVFKQNEQGDILQYVYAAEDRSAMLFYQDMRNENDREAILKQQVHAEIGKPFDLSSGPLLRAGIYQLADNKWVFMYVMHHIISDGWSTNILVQELLLLYNAYVRSMPNPLKPLAIQYRDYAIWQQEQLNEQALDNHKAYWLKQFEGVLPVLELPLDKPRPAEKTYGGAAEGIRLDATVSDALQALCMEQGCTLFMGLLAAVNIILYRYTGAEDMIIGSPIAGRDHVDLENQIGLYINTLALRTRLQGSDNFKELLARVRSVTLGAYDHQVYPFDQLLDELRLEKDRSRNYLFDVFIHLDDVRTQGSTEGLADLEISPYYETNYIASKFDLAFIFTQSDKGLSLSLQYSIDLFHQQTIHRMCEQVASLLSAIIVSPEQPIAQLNYIPAEERHRLLADFGSGEQKQFDFRSVTDLIEEQAEQHPDNMAVQYGDTRLSYRELNEQAGRLAHYLHKELGVQAGALVGILLNRSAEMIIAITGVLKAGAAYVPVDPDYPAVRRAHILRDAGITVLLTQTDLLPGMDTFTGTAINMDEQPWRNTVNASIRSMPVQPEQLAYVIYTSGSTGQPKGCAITHGNVSNYIQWANDYYFKDNKAANFGLFTSLSFDLTVTSIFCTLTQGGMLKVYSQHADLVDILRDSFSETSGINSLKLTPSHISLLKHLNISSGTMVRAIVGGEAVTGEHVKVLKDINKAIVIYNEYGPTETTVGCVVAKLEQGAPVVIGRPILNTKIYVLDEGGQLCAAGIPGEICISGVSVGIGYLNNSELTAARFAADPFRPGCRMYRTGDVGKWQSDGNLVFLGRRDDQVKLRGYRIELGEIEAALQSYEGVDGAVVVATNNTAGEKELVGYITSREPIVTAAISSWLHNYLPAYMVPAHIVGLPEFPLTVNGKVNKKLLPAPGGLPVSAGKVLAPPRNEIEAHLVVLWQELLGREQISVTDDFFNLGANSLQVLRLASNIFLHFNVKIGLKEFFEKTVLEDLALFILQARKTTFKPIDQAPVQRYYPLSSSQRRVWTVSQLEHESAAYNMPVVYLFEGAPDLVALNFSFQELIARHESLRTVFRKDEQGDVKQFILSPGETVLNIQQYDVSRDNDPARTANEAVRKESARLFDLAAGPLIRATLYRLSEHKWVLHFVIHHIVCDGWSMKILISELLLFYKAKHAGETPSVVPLRIQYKDYATWQQQQLTGGELKKHQDWWRAKLAGELPVLDLPGDKPRPAIKTNQGAAVNQMINAAQTGRLKELLQQRGCTLFMGVLALVKAILYRYTYQEDIIIGTQVAGREHIDLENQVGLYLNTLPLRTQVKGTDSFLAILDEARKVTTEAYAHQTYPFDTLIEELELQRDMSRNALFDVAVALENNGTGKKQDNHTGELQIFEYNNAIEVSKYDLAFHFTERRDAMEMIIVYNTDIYNGDTINRMAAHVVQLLDVAIADPHKPVGELEYLSATETAQLVNGFNTAHVVYPKEKTVVDLFEEQVARTPGNIALDHEGQQLAYSLLQEKANLWANALSSHHNVQPGDLVGVMLDRSAEMIIAILAILRSGAAYVPIDPEFPAARIAWILKDAGAGVLLTTSTHLPQLHFFEGTIVCMDGQLETNGQTGRSTMVKPQREDLAYVIYTSGSTGEPKGVMIRHESLVDYFYGIMARTNMRDCVHFGMVSTIAADLGNTVLYASLLTGGTLHIYDAATLLHPEQVFNNQLDCIKIVPSHWKSLQHANKVFLPAKCLIFGGEQLTPDVLELVKKGDRPCEVYNHYGPTETTIGKLINHLDLDNIPTSISLGSPFCNVAFYILDEQGKPTPPGVTGEICISGKGLAAGYINKPEQTAQKFVPNPFIPGDRMYRTGDGGRWLPNGTIEFQGRKDDQVKVRGYRIELGEIDLALKTHPDIQDAFIQVRPGRSGEKELVAYYVPKQQVSIHDLYNYLVGSLPAYMIPAHFVELEQLPLTLNGKVDRKRLPDPESVNNKGNDGYVAPVSDIEKKLVVIWEELLAKDRIGISDDYFALGGNSLKVIGILKRMMDATGITVPIKVFFQQKTIENIAAYIATQKAPPVKELTGTSVAPAADDALYDISWNQLTFLSGWKRTNPLVVTPYEQKTLDLHAFKAAVEQLLVRHEILRTKFVRIQGVIKQQVLAPDAASVEITGPVIISTEQELATFIEKAHARIIDPFTGPLFFIELYQLQNGHYLVLTTMHHLLTDGYSDGILQNDLVCLYEGMIKKAPVTLTPLPYQYRDFSAWQKRFLGSPEGLRHRDYWLKKLEGFVPDTMFAENNITGNAGDLAARSICVTRVIDGIVYNEIDQFTKKFGLTCPALLLGGLMLVQQRLTGLHDVAVLTAVSGRNSRYYENLDWSQLVGYFVNSLIVRNRISLNMPVIEFLLQVQQGFLEDISYDVYPIEKLIHELPQVKADSFLQSQVTLNYHNYTHLTTHDYKIKAGERTGLLEQKDPVPVAFGLVVKEYKNCLKLEHYFNQRLFDSNRSGAIEEFCFLLLQQLIAQPGTSIAQLVGSIPLA
jgi:tyrocidine synthetase III